MFVISFLFYRWHWWVSRTLFMDKVTQKVINDSWKKELLLADGAPWSQLAAGYRMQLTWWLARHGVYTKHIFSGSLKYTSDSVHQFSARLRRPAPALYLRLGRESRQQQQPWSLLVLRWSATVMTPNHSCQSTSLLRSPFMVCWHQRDEASSHRRVARCCAFTSRWVHESTRQVRNPPLPRGPYVGRVRRTAPAPGRSRSCGKPGRDSGKWAVGKHLVGDGVLVGEPLAARQVFIHRRNDLQDVVVGGQGWSS